LAKLPGTALEPLTITIDILLYYNISQRQLPTSKTKADTITENPCLSGADSQNSKIATTAVAKAVLPMPCSLALKGLHCNAHEWLL
jgi:hypothetical protein